MWASLCAYISAQGLSAPSAVWPPSMPSQVSGRELRNEKLIAKQCVAPIHDGLSSCQMISKHYRMSGCIIYRTPHHTPHIPVTLLMDLCAPLNDRTFIISFANRSPQTRVAFGRIVWHKHLGIKLGSLVKYIIMKRGLTLEDGLKIDRDTLSFCVSSHGCLIGLKIIKKYLI